MNASGKGIKGRFRYAPGRLLRPWFERWLDRRLPKTRVITLNQKRIFILPTPQGLGYLLMLFTIFIGGINYANSLILAVAFLLVSLFLVSILHTYGNLAGLQISAGRSSNAFVGEDAVFAVELRRHSDHEYEAIQLSWGQGKPQQVDVISGAMQTVRMLLPVSRRGRYVPSRLKVETRFPLGLLRAWSWIDLDTACLVYPKPTPNEYPRRASGRGSEGERLLHEGSDDFDGLKPYVAGDNPRNIAWKTYARSGELYSKVFVGQQSSEHWLDWDAYAGVEVEQRLSNLCYWVDRFGKEGRRFGLRLPGGEIAPAEGAAHRELCLARLACHGLSEQQEERRGR